MNPRINKNEIIDNIAKETKQYRYKVEQVVDLFLENIVNGVSNGSDVLIRGFGTFTPEIQEERKHYDMSTQEIQIIPKRIYPVFRAGKNLKKEVVKEIE